MEPSHPISSEPDLADLFQQGVRCHQSGRLAEAEAIYRQVLAMNPTHADGLHLLGVLLNQSGHSDQAVTTISRAIQLNPRNPLYYYNLGTAEHGRGNYEAAVACYRRALALNPEFVPAINNMGAALDAMGRYNEAIQFYRRATEIHPDFANAWYNMGNAFSNLGDAAQAIFCFRKAVTLDPKYVDAWYNLGNELKNQRQFEQALACYTSVLNLHPDHVAALNNQGTVLNRLGRITEAISCFQQAVARQPRFVEAWNNLGAALTKARQNEQAIAACQQALAIQPDYPEAWYTMGNALIDPDRPEQSIACYEKALLYRPDYPKALGALVHQLQQVCAWDQLETYSEKLHHVTMASLEKGEKTVDSPFSNISRIPDPAINYAVAKTWSQELSRTLAHLDIQFQYRKKDPQTEPITLGYLSHDFCNHPVAHLTQSLFQLHDRKSFRVNCYSYGPDDHSTYRKRIRQTSDRFADIRDMGHVEAARLIHKDGVDILIDLTGYTMNGRLEICGLRPAPIQVTYLGFPGTTGSTFMDYIITDPIVTSPDQAQFFSEQFVYMPHTFMVNDHRQPISDKNWDRESVGLPPQSIVFGSFNQPYKFDPVLFSTWMNILHRVPDSVLWIPQKSDTVCKNIRNQAKIRGISPDRIVFAPRVPSKADYLSRLQLADLMLDTRIYNGHTTTSDALWAGVPVITLMGTHFASRVSASLLFAVGLPELITHSPEAYEALAVNLALHPDRLRRIRKTLLENRNHYPLFDTPRFVQHLETAFKQMYARYIAGHPPESIQVARQSPELQTDSTSQKEFGDIVAKVQKLKRRGDFRQAAQCLNGWIADHPQWAMAHGELGNIYLAMGQNSDAMSCFDQVLQLNPQSLEARVNLAIAHRRMGKSHQAMEQIHMALTYHPMSPDASQLKGLIYRDLGQMDQARHWFEKALAIQADHVPALMNLGSLFYELEQFDDAYQTYHQVYEIEPGRADILAVLTNLSLHVCAWDELDALSDKLDRHITDCLENGTAPQEPPFFHIRRHMDPDRNRQLASAWSTAIKRQTTPLNVTFHHGHRSKLTIGYVSGNFGDHPVAHLIHDLLAHHDRSQFRIIAFSHGSGESDRIRDRIRHACDRFIDIEKLDHRQAAEVIHQHQVDILVDLMGHTAGNRLAVFAMRPAPVQVTWLGFPGTTGADFMDYIIADPVVIPEKDIPFYTEAPVYLPDTYMVASKWDIAEPGFSRNQAGLPGKGFVFCSFNQAVKLDPDIFDIWMHILRQVPDSVLWLRKWGHLATQHLRDRAKIRGIDPQRLIFAPRVTSRNLHLARLALADLVLDTPKFNGHASTADALWAGVPVLTVSGHHFASRVAASLLRAMNLPELITDNLDAYKRQAIQLATSPDSYHDLRQRVQTHRHTSTLFCPKIFARQIERAYQLMWRKYRFGEKPKPIYIS